MGGILSIYDFFFYRPVSNHDEILHEDTARPRSTQERSSSGLLAVRPHTRQDTMCIRFQQHVIDNTKSRTVYSPAGLLLCQSPPSPPILCVRYKYKGSISLLLRK